VSQKTYELSQYLVDVLGVVDVGARFSGRVTFHDSCHPLRYLGVREQPRRLIRAVSGAELIEMVDSDRCCGFGGSFSVKYPEISTAMVDYKARRIIEAGVDAVIGCDMGCLLNIGGYLARMGADVKVMHLAQLLAKTGEG
jgi:L-lactate dehydrogenase complex protein LldE